MKSCYKVYILVAFLISVIIITNCINKIENFEEISKIKVYCINRVSRPDRLKNFLDKIKSLIFYNQLDIEIVPAVDRDNLIVDDLKFNVPVGAIGCYLSHIKCFLNLLSTDKNVEYCLIFEDDAICKNELQKILEMFVKNPQSYDLLILGTNYRQGEIECVMDPELKVEICKGFTMLYGSHAYIVNKKAANILLSTAFPITKPYDLYYSAPEVYKKLKIGLTNISVCTQADGSDSSTN